MGFVSTNRLWIDTITGPNPPQAEKGKAYLLSMALLLYQDYISVANLWNASEIIWWYIFRLKYLPSSSKGAGLLFIPDTQPQFFLGANELKVMKIMWLHLDHPAGCWVWNIPSENLGKIWSLLSFRLLLNLEGLWRKAQGHFYNVLLYSRIQK